MSETFRELQHELAQGPMFYIASVTLNASEKLFLTNNNDPVDFDGETYDPFPFRVEGIESDGSGDLVATKIVASRVAFVDRLLFDDRAGFTGAQIALSYVSSAHLDDPSEVEIELFEVTSADTSPREITLNLSQQPLFNIGAPRDRCSERCRFSYKQFDSETGVGCPYVGEIPDCDLTRWGDNGCQKHGDDMVENQLARLLPRGFGGFPSLPTERR